MSIILVNTVNTCEFCGEEFNTSESGAWNTELYCCGECEVLDEADELRED